MVVQLMVIGAVAAVLAVAAFAVHRAWVLHSGGTEVLFRDLPAPPGVGWHHGVLRYGQVTLLFFRVSRLRPGPERSIPRRSLNVLGRREPVSAEHGLIDGAVTVLQLEFDGGHSELALDRGALTAFLAWVESSPPGRSRRELMR